MPDEEIVRRATIADRTDPDYLPSECLLHLIRPRGSNEINTTFRALFAALRRRILGAVRVDARRLSSTGKTGEKLSELQVQEAVVDKFQELLCSDRVAYEERLDFYEIRFNQALACLRNTARESVYQEQKILEPLTAGEDTNEVAAEVETALQNLQKMNGTDDFLFRSKLHLAISSLPRDERQVIELLLQELPIDSKDQEVRTIVQILGCTERTVRNRRDRAFARLRDALREGSET